MLRKLFILFGYLGYAIILAVALFIWKFPYNTVRARIVEQINSSAPVLVELGKLKPSVYPPGIATSKLAIYPRAGGAAMFTAGKTVFSIDLPGLLTTRAGASATAGLYNGTVTLKASSGAMFDFNNFRVSLDLDDVNLGSIPRLKDIAKGDVAGRVDAYIVLAGNLKSPEQATGEGEIEIEGLSFPMKSPILLVDRVDAGDVNGEVVIGQKDIAIKKITFKGEKMSGEMDGKVVRNNARFGSSTLDFDGTFSLDPKLVDFGKVDKNVAAILRKNKSLPLYLTGTVDKPMFKIF